MVIVINEYTGMSAEKPRKELIVSGSAELGDVVAGHGSVAYVINNGALAVYDEDEEEWIYTDGEVAYSNSEDEGSA